MLQKENEELKGIMKYTYFLIYETIITVNWRLNLGLWILNYWRQEKNYSLLSDIALKIPSQINGHVQNTFFIYLMKYKYKLYL